MGYTTEFYGSIEVDPPFSKEEIDFLQKFNETRRMNRTKGPYYVDGNGFAGQARDNDIVEYNQPPKGQPGLWCQWRPSDNGKFIEWDGGEKFYDAAEWMKYIIEHFIAPNAKAQLELPFLNSHFCNGTIEAQGEERDDRWVIVVEDNIVKVARALGIEYGPDVRI